jgi:hypothetical protein
MFTYQCAACGDLFQATFKLTWAAHCCAACGDYIADTLGEDRANPGKPMGLAAGSMRETAARNLLALGFKPPMSGPPAMRLVYCARCGCHYSAGSCPTHDDMTQPYDAKVSA